MVNSYLVHNGYSQTAEAFARQNKTGQIQREEISSIRNRQSNVVSSLKVKSTQYKVLFFCFCRNFKIGYVR